MNTEKVTYTWYFDNDKKSLPDKLKQVDKLLKPEQIRGFELKKPLFIQKNTDR